MHDRISAQSLIANYQRPTSYEVSHDFKVFLEELIDAEDESALKRYLDQISMRILRDYFPPPKAATGIHSVLHTSPANSLRLKNEKGIISVDVMHLSDPDRVAFDMGILLCVPELMMEHALVLEGRKLKADPHERFTEICTYENLHSDDEHYDMDQQACWILNLHPRAGQIMFYNPERVGSVEGGIRLLAPELFLTMPEKPTFEIVRDEARKFSDFIVSSFMRGFRGTRDRKVVDIVVNADKQFYTELTMMITLKHTS